MRTFLSFIITLFVALPAYAKSSDVVLTPERTIIIEGAISGAMYQPTIEAMGKLAATGKTIDMVIASPGGEVVAGSLIIDYMEQLKFSGTKFRCVVRDVAASMAFQLLLHCNERYATTHAYLLWHPVRVFYRGPLTGEQASSLGIQLAIADEMALHDLRAFLPMKEEDMLWHFTHETLHQAFTLFHLAPGFFAKVTNEVVNLRPEKAALNTAEYGNIFGSNQLIYIHERFFK